jgi:hypothetical protein
MNAAIVTVTAINHGFTVRWGFCSGEDGLDGTPGFAMTVLSAQALFSGRLGQQITLKIFPDDFDAFMICLDRVSGP